MTAPSDMRFKQRAVIEFHTTENIKSVSIYRRLLVVYRVETPKVSSKYHWALQVKSFEVEKVIIAD